MTLKKNPLILGVLNLTPDSFSDGGKYNDLDSALARAEDLEKQGADFLELGGESTGPNSKFVSAQTELKRVLPVLKVLRKKTQLPIFIDTYKAKVAAAALASGAHGINDVTALRGDPRLVAVLAQAKCPVVLMFAKDATPRTTIYPQHYSDVLAVIKKFLRERVAFATQNKIKREQIIVDPGLGHFISSEKQYSYEIIARLSELQELNCPILLGISRKSFLGGELKNRDERGLPLTGVAYLNGASIIRTHAVQATHDFLARFH